MAARSGSAVMLGGGASAGGCLSGLRSCAIHSRSLLGLSCFRAGIGRALAWCAVGALHMCGRRHAGAGLGALVPVLAGDVDGIATPGADNAAAVLMA